MAIDLKSPHYGRDCIAGKWHGTALISVSVIGGEGKEGELGGKAGGTCRSSENRRSSPARKGKMRVLLRFQFFLKIAIANIKSFSVSKKLGAPSPAWIW